MTRHFRPTGLLLAVALVACTSAKEKAEKNEQIYDAAMADQNYAVARKAMQEATQQDENQPRYWLKYARVLSQLTQYAPSLYAYERVLDYEPNNIEALQSAAELSAAGGDYAKAKEYVASLLKLQPDDIRGRIVQVAVMVRERRFAEAIGEVDRLAARGTTSDDLYLLKSRALEGLQRGDEAVKLLEDRDKATPGSIPVLRELVALYTRRSDDVGKRQAQARLASVTPGDPTNALAAATEMRLAGQAELANASIDGIQQVNAADADIQRQVVDYWRDAGMPDAALRAAQQAAARGNPGVRIAMAQAMIELGRAPLALDVIQQVLKGRTDVTAQSVEAQAVQANALAAAGRSAQALERVNAILAFDDTNIPALLLRGRLALARGDRDQALRDAQLLVANDGRFEQGLILLADTYAARGERTLADVAYVRARNTLPDSIETMLADAGWRLRTGRPAQAVELARDFAARHPKSRRARLVLADVCRKAGDKRCAAPPPELIAADRDEPAEQPDS